MTDAEFDTIGSSALFCSIPRAELKDALSGTGRTERFTDGAVIPAATETGRRLGIVLSGVVSVMGAGDVPLNRIGAGGTFGAAALFSDKEGAPTRLVAKKPVTVYFLTEAETERLTDDPRIRRSLLAFLCDRIRFLNRKVATFSAQDAKTKLSMALSEREKCGVVVVEGGLAQLARSLDLGRASLYRALDSLEKEGAIRRRGKIIEITAQGGSKSI